MPHFPNFTTLPKIWLLTRLLFPSREGWFSNNTYQKTRFGIKIFKLCDSTGYTYDMKVYLGKDRQRTAQYVIATHATVTELTRKIEGRGRKLYMDNFFSSPELIWWLGEETDLLLWHCQTEQERPKTEDNKTETGRHSRKNQGWLDGNTLVGQERCMHVDHYSQCPSGR